MTDGSPCRRRINVAEWQKYRNSAETKPFFKRMNLKWPTVKIANRFSKGNQEVDLAPPIHVWDPCAPQKKKKIPAEVKRWPINVRGCKSENWEKTGDLTELGASPPAAQTPLNREDFYMSPSEVMQTDGLTQPIGLMDEYCHPGQYPVAGVWSVLV